jgi:lipopolysaccharide transport system permease protein/teichoic acid transport system permease protein
MKSIHQFFFHIFMSRSIIFELAKRDMQQKYMGSYLGFIWVFLQPLLFILVLYTVMTLGFRGDLVVDMPFSVYLVSGMVAWLVFTEHFNSTTKSIKEYSFLVKRIDFRLSVLPLVKLISVLLPHMFLILVAILLAWSEGYPPSIYSAQVFYYMFALSVLLIGLGWLTSSTSVFVKDVSNFVTLIIQFGFWLTPIFWSIQMFPEKYRWIFKLNPMYYVVNGYRDSLVLKIPFWERPMEAVYFWSVAIILLLTGAVVYKRLRPHFAEVV